jgi:hypothetical protein
MLQKPLGKICVLLLVMGWAAGAMAASAVEPSLDRGFRLMYDLDFTRAQQEFATFEQLHPRDPLGPVSEAAGLLFSELNRLGVLDAQFYEKDSTFQARKKLAPDAAVRVQFDRAIARTSELVQPRMTKDPRDRDALFALTLSAGLHADYAALIEKRNLASLHYSRQATSWAEQLLAADPAYYDAYLATGMNKYILGSMSAPMRWMLRLGGMSGDKDAGIADLQRTAEHGHYLAPFARMLLAIAYLRQQDREHARNLLAGLRDEFPDNPLFAREIARLDEKH